MPPKKISLVRHAQGYHNLHHDGTIPDPLLTPLGKQQCAALSKKFPDHETADLVVASPLRRTVQTAAYSFGPALARKEVPFILFPGLQEVGNFASDTGTDASLLQKTYEDMFEGEELGFELEKIDRGLVEEGWNSKKGYYAYTREALSVRAADVRNWLFQRPESHIIIVTHGAFAHFITEDWDVADPMTTTAYANCEVREFAFTKQSKEGEAHLVETSESRKNRGKEVDVGETDDIVVDELEGVLKEGKGEGIAVGA